MSTAATGDEIDSANAAKNNTKRTAGFWAVLFMVIGIQFAGLASIWSYGATQGLKKLLLAHALIGTMYLLLSFCFAELVSIVPFAGGSFGYCRASLGPFWGFMVGASEVLENVLKVVVTVILIGAAITAVFETKKKMEPFWHAIAYTVIYGVHLRGGALLWYTVIMCGFCTMVLILMFCVGNMKDMDIELWGRIQQSSFEGEGKDFLGTLYYPIWIYIGLEIVPQTCERVKNVQVTLPRALVIANFITFGVCFWVLMCVTSNFPGMYLARFWNNSAFPLSFGYFAIFDTPDFTMYGPALAVLPLFSSALGFMWGCGYQVASLARSGLLPSIFAKTWGENETPVVALSVSTILQFILCSVLRSETDIRGPRALYLAMMIGASMVYVGMFLSFIVFRVRFSGMKRHWVSWFGIPGAVIGICLALLLCISVIVLQKDSNSLIIYFVYMFLAAVYYIFYARHTQYFSPEEQKQFMKAYILNANKGRGGNKARTPQQKMMDSFFEPINRMFALPMSAFSKSASQVSHPSMTNSASATKKSADRENLAMSVRQKHNAVAPASIELPSANKASDEVRRQEAVPPARNHNTRASWTASGSTKVGWSGKAMTMTESKKFLEVLASDPTLVADKLVEALPNQFVTVAADAEQGNHNLLVVAEGDEGRDILLNEIVEGIANIDDDDHGEDGKAAH